MAEAEIISRLDRLIAVLELAHRDEIARARDEIRGDATYAEILRLSADEVRSGPLSKAVQQKTKQSPKTVQRRIGDLIELGALKRTGAGGNTKYKATGLI